MRKGGYMAEFAKPVKSELCESWNKSPNPTRKLETARSSQGDEQSCELHRHRFASRFSDLCWRGALVAPSRIVGAFENLPGNRQQLT